MYYLWTWQPTVKLTNKLLARKLPPTDVIVTMLVTSQGKLLAHNPTNDQVIFCAIRTYGMDGGFFKLLRLAHTSHTSRA